MKETIALIIGGLFALFSLLIFICSIPSKIGDALKPMDDERQRIEDDDYYANL